MSGELTVVVDGLGFVEAPRWHDGRLWYSDFSARTVSSVDEAGAVTLHAYVAGQPSGLGFAPNGDLLVVSTHEGHVLRIDEQGVTLVADVGAIYRGGLNDMTVDEAGRAYISAFPAHVAGQRTGQVHGEPSVPLFLVTEDGRVDVVAQDLAVPNGMALVDGGSVLVVAETLGRRLTAFDVETDGKLANRRVFADLGERKPDGVCADPDDGVWFGSPFTSEYVRVREGGEVVDVIETPGRWAVSCAVGGADGRTLWCATVAVTLEEYRQGGGRGAVETIRLDGLGARERIDAMTYDFSGLGFADGEIAVVTGAGNGIGRSTALMLARAGVTVVGWDLDGAGLAAVADEIASSGGAFESAVGDLTDEAFIEDAWQRVAALGRPVPYLVNNAGPPSTTQMSVAEGVRIAIGSYATVAEGFVAHCGESASSMTFTASIAGNFYVGPTPDWYPAAKAGIAGLVRQLAVRLRGRPRCNGIAPAGIKTQRTAEMPQAVIDKIARRPLGRMGEPDEVATLICYLLSPAASFINGVLVPVDGAATWTD